MHKIIFEISFVYWILLICGFGKIHGNDIQLTYYDGNNKFISVSEKQQGSTANLGIYPHWCIANINKCNNGLTLSFWFKPNPAPDNSSAVTILTTGGHLFYSEGIYFSQQYGDQYELGVAKSKYLWNTKFRLVPSFWTHLILYWDENVGIKVYMDEKLLEMDKPKTRKYIPQSFDPFSEIIIGIDEYQTPLNSRNLFEIQDIKIHNKIIDKHLIPINESFAYRGCILDSNNAGQVSGGFRAVNATISMRECREYCSEKGYQVIQFKAGKDCVCFMREKIPTLSKSTQCSSDKPKFYTALNSDDYNPYDLTVTVEKLQIRNYVKPFETVNIHIQTNIKSKLTFNVDFGDGIFLSTMEKKVSHFWNSQGNFTITVRSTLGILRVSGTTTFEIIDVDEGVKPEMVLISGLHKQSSAMTGDFEMVTVDREDTNCTVNFSDGSSLHKDTYKTLYAETKSISHSFPAFGGYSILAKCHNLYGSASNEAFFISKKFEIPFLYYPKGSNFSIDVAGTNEYVAKETRIYRNYENTSLSTIIHGNTITISEKDLQYFDNLITLKSHGEDVMQRIFFVEKILGKPSIFVDTKNSAWNLTTNITVVIPDGNHIFINCTFGVGDDRLFYITEADNSTQLVFEIQYDGLGYYPLQVVISNDLSYETVEGLISVEVPLETIHISTSNITDKTLPVELIIDINAGKRGPDKVKFTIDHDDGNTMTYAYRSHTDTFTKYENKYVYRDWGIYYICVTAYNEISSVQACTLVQVGQNITYIDVQTNTTARVTTIEYAEVNITTMSGSDLTYLVDFGDGYPFEFTDRQLQASAIVSSSDTVSTAPITYTEFREEFAANNATSKDGSINSTTNGSLSRSKRDASSDSDPRSKATRLSATKIKVYHIFTKPGRYSVKVRISNAFSAKWTYLCTAILVDNVDISQCLEPTISFRGIQSSMESPITRVRSLDIPIIVDATSNCGSTFTYAWKGIKYIDNLQVPVDSLCENDNNGAEFRIKAVTLTFGLYRLTVTVAPYGYKRNAVQKDLFLQVEASSPYAELAGEKEDWVLIYESTTLDVSPSRDPDFGNRHGLTYDLFCCLKQEFDIIHQMDLETLRTKATPIYDDVTYKRETDNLVTLYQYGQCFEVEDNSTDEFTAVQGQVNFPTEFFIESATDFSFKLFVSKEGRINSTFKHLEVRLTNASSLDDLVNNLDNIKDAAGMIRAVSSITKNMDSANDTGTDATEKRTQFREKMAKNMKRVCGTENSPKQAKSTMKVLETVTKNGDEVSQNTRMDSSDAVLKSASNLNEKFGEEDLSSLSDAATAALDAASNVIPKPSADEQEFANMIGDPPTDDETDGDGSENEDDEVDDTTGAADDQNGVTSIFIQGNGSYYSSSNDTGTTSYFSTSPSTTTRATTTRGQTGSDVSTADLSHVFTIYSSTRKPQTNSSGMQDNTGTSDSQDGGYTTVNPHGVTRKTNQGSGNGQSKGKAKGTQNQGKGSQKTPQAKQITAKDWLFKEFNKVKEGDSYYKILKKLGVEHSEQIFEFYKCLFSSKVVTRNVFTGALRRFKDKMDLPENILEKSYTEIFSTYIWEWEPYDIDEYINQYCRIIEAGLDDERKNADKNVAGSVMGAVDSLSGLMLGKKEKEKKKKQKTDQPNDDDDEPPMTLKAKGMELQMQTINPNGTAKKPMGTAKGGINLSPKQLPSTDGNCSVGVKVLVNDDNQFTYGDNSKDIKTSLVTIDFSDPCSGTKFKVEDTQPMEIFVAGKPEDVPDPAISLLCIKRTASPDDPKYFNYQSANLTSNDTTIHLTIWPEADGDVFEVYIKYQDYPNATYYDYKTTVPKDKSEFPGVEDGEKLEYMRHTFFPPPEHTKYNGTYKMAIKVRKRDRYDFQQDKVCLNYTSTLLIASCKYWDEKQKKYRGEGCTAGNETTKWSTQCWCTHLTSFGGDFAVPPNTIDFNTVWSKFDVADNPAVFSTVIALVCLYIIIIIWARKKDKKDLIKWGATPLEDNLPSDNYHYQVTIYTGAKKNASTRSNVSIVLSGDECDSGVRRLYDGIRKEFPKGSIYNFILSVEIPLGQLSFLRVWHDNSGKGKLKSWYLDQVQVTDLQTGERFFFLCDRWLAVEEDDGMVDRIIPVAGLEDLAAFKQLFSSSAKKKLTSDHLWFSVFSRPTRSSFTRVQRISCCMSLLFMTMITNAMWFKTDGDPNQKTTTLKMGPFSFTLQQVFISFASTMIVFPVNFILITFFRRCRQKKNAIMQKNQQVPKKGKWKNVTNGSQLWGSAPKKTRWRKFKDSIDELITSHQRRRKYAGQDFDDVPEEEPAIPEPRIAGDPDGEKKIKEKRKKKPKTLPYWCIYIAWVLCFLSITLSGFFTILYSMEWGKEKANEWLTTFLMSFFQSVVVVQPLKVMAIVAFIACILKKPDLDEEDGGEELNNVIMAHDEEMLKKTTTDIDEIALKRKQANDQFKPPDTAELEKARQTRLNELRMEAVFKELAAYVIFVLILFFLSYQQRDSDSFTYAENLKNYFGSGFDSVTTVDQYWSWLDQKLLPSMYATHYPDGTRMRRWWNKRCIGDLQSRRVGIPRLRQLRVKDDSCNVNPLFRNVIQHCRDEYGWTDDDAKPYLPGWVEPPEENITALKKQFNPWVYQNSIKLRSAPYIGTIGTYKGGGYAVLFEREVNRTRKLLEGLKNQIWMDANTRAIFLEFTVYNPNINLFGSMIMLIEFQHSGGATQRMEFKIFRLLSYVGGLGILVLIAEVLYACFTLYFLVRFISKMKKERMKYFKSFWNKLEFALLVFSCAVIAMYAFKQILTSVTLKALKDSSKADYVNFQSMALYDEMYGWMCACVVFLATVQFLKLLQFNKKMNMLGDTVSLSAKDLKVFSITCSIYIWAFISTGFLLFGKDLLDYASLINSAEALFSFALGAFDFDAMNASNKILGPLFFFMFIAIVYVGLMSMFLTILADAFTQVKANVDKQSNDYELVDFMVGRLKAVMGFGRRR